MVARTSGEAVSDKEKEYKALTMHLLDMSEELEKMGGGDTRICPLKVVVRVRPGRGGRRAVQTEGSEVRVLEGKGKEGDGTTCRTYKMTAALPANSSQKECFQATALVALNSLWDGFNASVVAVGQTGTGKTYSLYGDEDENLSLLTLKTLFERIRQSHEPNDFIVMLSLWEVGVSDANDLLAPQKQQDDRGGGAGDKSFTCVEVESLSDAMQVLEYGHSRSSNWIEDDEKTMFVPTSNRCHSFMRITLYDKRKRRISSLHLIDLVGYVPLNGARTAEVAFNKKQVYDRERRMMSQQLISFNRLLAEISSKHERSGCSISTVGSDSWVSSSRDSRLTQAMSPLLAGNNQTIILCTISPDAEDQLDTLNSLRCCHRALCISNACHRILNIDAGDFSSLPSSEILGAALGGTRGHHVGRGGSRKQPVGGSMHQKVAELEDEVYHARLELSSSDRRKAMPEERRSVEERRSMEERKQEERKQEERKQEEDLRRRMGEHKARVRFDHRQVPQRRKEGGPDDKAWQEAYREISSIDESIRRRHAGHEEEDARASDGWKKQSQRRSPAQHNQAHGMRHEEEARKGPGEKYARDDDEAYEIEEEDFDEEVDELEKSPDDLRNEFHHVLDRMRSMDFQEDGARSYSPIQMEGEEEEEEEGGWVFHDREEAGRHQHQDVRDNMQREDIDHQYAEIVQRIAKQANFSSLDDEQEVRDREEFITRQEIKLVELRQEVMELKRRLRLAMSEGGQEEVFSEYEAEISRLSHALSQARQQQMASDLAAQEASSLQAGDRARDMRDFTRKNLTRLQKEFEKVSKENESLRRERRTFLSQKKFLQDMVRKASHLQQALNTKEDELQREKERVEEAHKKAIDLQFALGEANRKEQLLKDEMKPLRSELTKLVEANRRSQRQMRTFRSFADEEHLKPKGNLIEQLDKLEHEVGFFRPKLLPRIKELRAEIEAAL